MIQSQDLVRRYSENPLLEIADVPPWLEDAFVFGVFNCGATRFQDEILLLLRIAEKPIPKPGVHSTFLLDTETAPHKVIRHDVPASNTTGINYNGYWCTNYFSYLRLARSTDGINFTVDPEPIFPGGQWYDRYGLEDPRITKLDEVYYINYSAISEKGVHTVLLSTTDWSTYTNHGIIFPPNNKDVTIFPEKINGQYWALHRPDGPLCGPSMYIASSPDLIHWGNHHFLRAPVRKSWEEVRVGCGPHPIATPEGWLVIYHAADQQNQYCQGAMLLDKNDPTRVLAVGSVPFFRPLTWYENTGYLPGVVFCCGHLVEDDGRIVLYYGAADDKVCAAETSVSELLAFLKKMR